MGGPNTAAKLMKNIRKRRALSAEVDISNELDVEMRATLQNWEMSKSILCLLPLILFIVALLSFLPYGGGGTMFPVTALLLATVLLLTLWPASLYRKKKVAEDYFAGASDEEVDRKPLLAELLQRMEHSYQYPIVLLVMREHPQLYFTGKSFLTSNDVTLHEAVFLPS